MSDNMWHGDIEVDIDAAKAESAVKSLEGRVNKLASSLRSADDYAEEFEADLDHMAGAVARAGANLNKLNRNVHVGASGLRDMGQAAQVAERQVQKLYQTYAAAQLAQKRVPQNMANWLPSSGVSQGTKDQILGANTAINGNVISSLRQEEAARESLLASVIREEDARKRLAKTSSNSAYDQREIDRVGQLGHARAELTRATLGEQAALSSLVNEKKAGREVEESGLAASQRYTEAIRRRQGAQASLRAAEEAHAESTVRAMASQEAASSRLAATRERQEGALRTAQGRLQAENETEAYRKLEGSIGRTEAAKRRLAAAQRQVNAAQEGLKGATGDLIAQTAATNKLADAKRKLASAEIANRAAQQPVGNMDSTRYALYDVGATAGIGAAAGGLALGATIKNFAMLETQFATVSRTSEETGHNLSVMSNELLDMGSRIPVPLQGLTDMAARAAQLGVEGQRNILAFTETMSKFAAISDTVTETEVAEYFGRLNNLTGNLGNWEEMADAVARVGITSAATDQQVLKTAQEIAQAGAGANYSQKEIIGLAGAFASLAVPPERARSVLLDLNKIMTKGMGESTESMKSLSAQMGISEDAIRGMWRAKPTELISEMAKSLKDMEPEEVMTFLSDFGLKGARALPVFMAIAKDAKAAGDGISVFDRAQKEAANSSGELDKQFSITMETLTAAWQTFLNSVQAGGFEAMSDIGPILTDVLNGAGDLLDWSREFLATDLGGFVGTAALSMAALATAVAGVASFGAIAGASLLAIKSAAASGLFGPAAARTIGSLGNNSKLASQGMVMMGDGARNAAPKLSTLSVNATRAEKAMAGLRRAGSGMVGVLGGPVGVALAAATAIGILGQNAVQTAQSYRDLGQAITEVNAETGQSMGAQGMLQAATQNVLNNDQAGSMAYGLQSSLLGENISEMSTSDLKEYLKLFDKGQQLIKSGQSTGTGTGWKESTGSAYANMNFQNGNGRGEVGGRALNELGVAMSKLDSSQASVAFQQLAKDLGVTESTMDSFVTSLGGEFTDAFYDTASAAGAVKSELGGVNVNGDIGNFMLQEYSKTAKAAKDNITQMNPALEEMAEGFQGVFDGMAEGAKATGAMFSALLGGVQSADQLKNAMVELGIVNAETGELTGETVDLYDEVTGKWTLLTAEQQAAVGALSAYAQAQVAGIAGEYALTSAIQGSDVALTNAQATMDASREHFIEQAGLLGINATEAGKMADALGLVEGQYLVVIDTSTLPAAKDQVQAVLDKVNEVPGAKSIAMTALTADAKLQLEALGFTVNEVDGEYIVTITDQGTAAATESAIKQIPTEDETKVITVELTGAQLVIDDLNRITAAQAGVGVGTVLKPEVGYYPQNTGPGSANGGLAGTTRGFANGRFTGTGGGKHTVAGVVHKKEYVFPAGEVDPVRGVPALDSLGRMIAQHYPQAMNPNIVVQGGGGNGGVVALDAGTMHQLARMVSTQVRLDGQVLASSVNGQNKTSAQRGSN